MPSKSLHICMTAGEESGDILGSHLMVSLRESARKMGYDLKFSGVGGQTMEQEGLQSLFPMRDLSVMGVVEVVPRIPKLLKRINQTASHVVKNKPDLFISIDSPDFSFRVARRIKEKSDNNRPKMVHYVAPTVWAWRPERAKKVADLYDSVLCLFPFEPEYFEREGMDAEFVGHPAMRACEAVTDKDVKKFRKDHDISDDAVVFGILFGSRLGELNRTGPELREAVKQVIQGNEMVHVVSLTLPHLEPQVKNLLQGIKCKKTIITDRSLKWQCLRSMNFAVATSGTVGLELALADVCHVIGYKMSKLTWRMVRNKFITRYAHLVNIMLDCPIVPEFIQDECRAPMIQNALELLVRDEELQKVQRDSFAEVRKQLSSGSNKVIAERILSTYDPL